MTNLMLVIGLIAFLTYGYWLMERLDGYFSGKRRRQVSPAKLWEALQGALAASIRRAASLLPEPRAALARNPESRESHTPFAA